MMIGCVNSDNTILKSGPKAFMDRLKLSLQSKGIYTDDYDEMDVYIALSFIKIPQIVLKKKIRVIVRFDGIRNWSLLPPFRILNIFNKVQLGLLNKQIYKNLKLADKLIFQSHFSKEQNQYLIEKKNKNIDMKKNIIIYNGIQINENIVKSLDKDIFPQIVILHRFHPTKRTIQIPKILFELKKVFPNFKAYFIGGGVYSPYRPHDTLFYIKKEITRLDLNDNVKVFGHLTFDELKKILHKGDFMLNLSFSDPCPNAVIEAQSFGLPVIAPNLGGIPEIVPNKDLLINENIDLKKVWPIYFDNSFPEIDVNEYINKILYLCNNIEKYQKQAFEFVKKNHILNDVVEKYIDFATRDEYQEKFGEINDEKN